MNLGQAIELLKQGKKVTRKGWNGKGMYIKIMIPKNDCCDGFPIQPCIGMKTVDCKMQPGWLASQADILAEDWEVIE